MSFETTARVRSLAARAESLGPTWVAGAIAAGPATLASLVAAGASYGYTLLWVVVLSAVFGALAQYLSTRLGLSTETGIVSAVDDRLGRRWKWLLVADGVLAAGLAQLVIMKTLADVSAAVTGVGPRVWGVAWAVVLAVGLAGGGYRAVELGAKVLVSLVVVAFVASVFVVPIDPVAAMRGLVPVVPAGASGALLAASVLGGAVHVTLVTMQTYTVRARGWTADDAGAAVVDVASSMLAAFGVYSVAIFLVSASVLHSPSVDPAQLTATRAAEALGPLAGPNARWFFMLGLWGAAVSTLGGNTVAPPYLLADALGWETDVSDGRYRVLLAGVALLSAAGAFYEGSFFPLLPLVLAFGLVGTPFALSLVLYLLNDPDAAADPPSTAVNVGGLALVGVSAVTAGSFVRERVVAGFDPVTGFVLGFALVLGTATLALGVRYVRR